MFKLSMLPIEEIFKNWLFCKNKNILSVTKYFWYKLIRLEGTVTSAQLGREAPLPYFENREKSALIL